MSKVMPARERNPAKPNRRPLAWVAHALSRFTSPAETTDTRGVHKVPVPPRAASARFVEWLPADQEFRLSAELLGALSEPGSNGTLYQRLLAEIETITGAQGSILYCDQPKEQLVRVLAASVEQSEHSLEELLDIAHPVEDLPARSVRQHRALWVKLDSGRSKATSADVSYHHVLLYFPHGSRMGNHELEMLQRIGINLNDIMHNLRRANLDQQFIHNRERAIIARELHDSLAQSLSFLKIQLARLESRLHNKSQKDLRARLEGPLADLRKGVNLSYRQLRELINTFRLTMNGRDLAQALEDSLEEFKNLSDMVFAIDNRLTGIELSAEEETHVLLVVREALSNAARHSRGTRAEATLWSADDGTVNLSIDDDGIGLKDTEQDGCHGLDIMRQRMTTLGGALDTSASPLGGARIRAKFHPRSTHS